jgi:hypothetical protein
LIIDGETLNVCSSDNNNNYYNISGTHTQPCLCARKYAKHFTCTILVNHNNNLLKDLLLALLIDGEKILKEII